MPGKCRAASHTASAMIASGERRTPARFGCCFNEATRSIVRVASTRTHTAARLRERALHHRFGHRAQHTLDGNALLLGARGPRFEIATDEA